jgi:hypothetical protein
MSASSKKLRFWNSDAANDPELNHVSGHPVDCRCKECFDRQLYLELLEDRTIKNIHAEQDEAREAAVPLEVRLQQMAEGDYAEAAIQASRIGSIRSKVQTTRDGNLYRASSFVREQRGLKMSDSDFHSFNKAVQVAGELSQRDRQLAVIQSEYEQRANDASVIAEPAPYGDGSPHSWVHDVLASAGNDPFGATHARAPGGHEKRLQQHGEDIGRALQKRDGYGRAIERMYQEGFRQQDPRVNEQQATKALRALRKSETRALSTGGGATVSAGGGGASAFVPPAILLDAWATYRSPYRAFADQLDDSVAMPTYGLTAYVPSFTTGTTVATHTENTGVAEGDPVSGFASGVIIEKAGQVTVSQAFIDRAGPGISGDQVLFTQLKSQLDAQIDAYAITMALANAQAVTNAGAFALTGTSGVGGFLKDLKSAKNLLHDTAGVRLRGTHAFATGDFVDFISSFADGQGMPVFSPSFDDNRLPIRSAGDGTAEGYSGYVLTGLALFADDLVPVSGSNTQIIVCRPSTILLLEGAPVSYLAPQGAAGNLEAIAGVRAYVTAISRYPSGVSNITGAAYAASTFA